MVRSFQKLIVTFPLIVALVIKLQSLVSETDAVTYMFIHKVIVKFVVPNFLKYIVQRR